MDFSDNEGRRISRNLHASSSMEAETVNFDDELALSEEDQSMMPITTVKVDWPNPIHEQQPLCQQLNTDTSVKISDGNSLPVHMGKENIPYHDVVHDFYRAVDEGSCDAIEKTVYKYNLDVGVVFTSNFEFVKRKHHGWTAAHLAASHGNVKALRFLFAEGCDIESLTPDGETALHVAAKHGAAEVVAYLLDCNVFLRDRPNKQGITALLKTIFNFQPAFKVNYRRCVDLLLGAGCNPNISSSSKVMPLHVAVDKGDLQLVRRLIIAGANVNALCSHNTSPLLRALILKNVNAEIVTELLLAGADTSLKMNGKSTLHIAVSRCDDRVIETFLQCGANPNCLDASGNTPLTLAVEENIIKVVPILVAGGGDVNYAKAPQCISLLSQAVLNSSLPMVKLLLQLGATVHTETCMWSTPLHHAVDQQNIPIIMELLRANCSLNSTSNAKYSLRPLTPFQLAMELGNVEIMFLLIQVGCKVQWSWLREDRLPPALASKGDVVRHINKCVSKIPSLLHLSRISLREHLGDRFGSVMTWLRQAAVVPNKIADYIALKDILDS
ncbi:putative ankyrin repeat protein RF_0381 [Physella acuta]|uniref:putative ankyrin repeat protein RF_0381 n=1 Tax=Physella acuta TaxID=109671 RepID=UPI0027DBF573|nr:putative ankyrin repeat protein RF_0381 [Physella acuta]